MEVLGIIRGLLGCDEPSLLNKKEEMRNVGQFADYETKEYQDVGIAGTLHIIVSRMEREQRRQRLGQCRGRNCQPHSDHV